MAIKKQHERSRCFISHVWLWWKFQLCISQNNETIADRFLSEIICTVCRRWLGKYEEIKVLLLGIKFMYEHCVLFYNGIRMRVWTVRKRMPVFRNEIYPRYTWFDDGTSKVTSSLHTRLWRLCINILPLHKTFSFHFIFFGWPYKLFLRTTNERKIKGKHSSP